MKKNKLKRIVAIMMACIMLCGLTITASASASTCPSCGKEMTFVGVECYNSHSGTTHPYVDENGTTKTCETVIYYNRTRLRCDYCGEVKFINEYTAEIHMQCGQL